MSFCLLRARARGVVTVPSHLIGTNLVTTAQQPRMKSALLCLTAHAASFYSTSTIVAAAAFAANSGGVNKVSMPPLTPMADYIPLAKKAMSYIDSSPDPFHAIKTSADMLEEAGFVELPDSRPYSGNINPGGKYYFTKNRSTMVAFTVGEKYQPGNGFKIIGGHTDSPNLKVKPRSKKVASDCIQLRVECYGGGLWHTWFDRDLGISGRVLVRNER